MTTARRRSELAAARKAAGHTQESLAGALYVDRSTVIRWESGENAPWPYLRPKLARMLGISASELQRLVEPRDESAGSERLDQFGSALTWLDEHAGWRDGTARRKVAAKLGQLDPHRLQERNTRRSRVTRSEVVRALNAYYGSDLPLYRRTVDGHSIATTIATRPEWLDLHDPLTLDTDRFTVASSESTSTDTLGSEAARAAVNRVAEAAILDVRIVGSPLYRLLSLEISAGEVGGTLGLAQFVDYALTSDLLEGELLDKVSQARSPHQAEYPLRAAYLPNIGAVFDTSSRVCAGGVLALCAIARPAADGRAEPDYALLVQRRSPHVVNAAGRLSVIPKGFHRPMSDRRADASLAITLRRELDEEVFGRVDLDVNSSAGSRVADLMHPARQSKPMQWLNVSDALTTECTGFGLNLVSGNYEFACLVVIDDEKFWETYGSTIEANWEASGLYQCSSQDRKTIAEIIQDESWTNEGVFAFAQGLRRLNQLAKHRVDIPSIE